MVQTVWMEVRRDVQLDGDCEQGPMGWGRTAKDVKDLLRRAKKSGWDVADGRATCPHCKGHPQ